MKYTHSFRTLFVISLFLFFYSIDSISGATCDPLRLPYVSGSFYPADKEKLSAMLDGYLAKVPELKKPAGEIVALISPHAGYIYSGQTAAYGYKLIEGMPFDTVIILGPFHKSRFPGASIWSSGCWETPLGEIEVDSALAEAIIKENSLFSYTQDLHLLEHSIEMELPFLQKVLKNFKIVPILVSNPSVDMAQLLAKAILKNIQGRKVLIIASTDMSHYYPDSVARKMDALTLSLLKSENSAEFLKQQNLKKVELCGSEATVTVLELAKLMGNTVVELLNYSNSGDVTGDKNRVVGYGSLVIYKTAPDQSVLTIQDAPQAQQINVVEQKELLNLSRKTLDSFVITGKIPDFEIKDALLQQKQAVFVTLKKNNQLRGCIGSILPKAPLYLAVRDLTVQSASQDPRFKPVQPEELKDIKISISILSQLQKVKSADEIVLGKHGVIVKQGNQSGVFLHRLRQIPAGARRSS